MSQPYARTYWARYGHSRNWTECTFHEIQGGYPSRRATFHEDLGFPQDRAQQLVDEWNGHVPKTNCRYSLTKPEGV